MGRAGTYSLADDFPPAEAARLAFAAVYSEQLLERTTVAVYPGIVDNGGAQHAYRLVQQVLDVTVKGSQFLR